MSIPALAALSTKAMFAASLGVSAVTAAAKHGAEVQQYEAQVAAQEENQKNVREAALSDMVQQTNTLIERKMQEREATALRVQSARTKAREAVATATAAGGAEGVSAQMLLADYERQYGNYANAQATQLGFTDDQISRMLRGVEAEAQSRINSVPSVSLQRPSLGLALAEFGASALNSYNQYSVVDPLTGDRTLT